MNSVERRLKELQAVEDFKKSVGMHSIALTPKKQKVRCWRCRSTHIISTCMIPPVPLNRCTNCMTLSDKELRNRGK